MINLSTVIVVLFFIILVHFLYWSIIVPNLRLAQRHKGFIIRDKLHNIRYETLEKEDLELLKTLENSIKNIMNRMNDINIINLVKINKILTNDKNDKNVKKIIEKIELTSQRIEFTKNNELKNINNDINDLVKNITVINLGLHIIFISPLLILTFFIKKVFISFKKQVKSISTFFEFTPSHTYKNFNI